MMGVREVWVEGCDGCEGGVKEVYICRYNEWREASCTYTNTGEAVTID